MSVDCVHLVTPFDSGGSSAALRRAFAMPAVGDMRNRLLALADETRTPAAVLAFLDQRLPVDGDAGVWRAWLRELGKAAHPLWASLPQCHAEALRRELGYFLHRMPAYFDPHAASLGNLVLAGGYLRHKRNFGPVLALFHQMLHCRGTVLPIVEESLHLGAELADGTLVVGQHHFRALPAPVRRPFLTVHEPDRPLNAAPAACRPPLSRVAAGYLHSAGAICYPMGSFYSSVLANLIPSGVGAAVAGRSCPKIFVPNSGHDAEAAGLCLSAQVDALLDCLRMDVPTASTGNLLTHVLVDSRHGVYAGGLGAAQRRSLAGRGIQLVDCPLVRAGEPQRHEPELTARALLAVAAGRRPEGARD